MQASECSAAEMPCPAQREPSVVHGFRLLRQRGVGASANVYEAQQLSTGRKVALKRLRPGATHAAHARLRAEAALLAELQSDHIVHLDEDHSAHGFFTMELLDGDSLEQVASEPLSPARVLRILRPLAQGLHAAHRRGVVHCDLKPENVIVRSDSDGPLAVTLLDFGIARRMPARGEGSDWFGTPVYMSPEQALGRLSELDQTTDVWAFAQLTFRLLTGRSYYPSELVQRTLLRIAFDPIEPPSAQGCRVSAAFDAWFMRSCARDPQRRYRSVLEQFDELATVLDAALVRVDVPRQRHSLICDGQPILARRPQAFAWVAGASTMLLSFYALWS